LQTFRKTTKHCLNPASVRLGYLPGLMDTSPSLRIAVIGAGPVGLALSLQAARALPKAHIALFDARPLERDVSADPRTLALALGSVQLLQRLGAWPGAHATPIEAVHVSQAPPSLDGGGSTVRLSATDQGVPMLGAVIAYGPLVSALQAAWCEAVAASGGRLQSRFGVPVAGLKAVQCASGASASDSSASAASSSGTAGAVEVDAGIAETFDLAVVAEGGVFADQVRKALTHDYQQNAWVGTATLEGAAAGTAFERFTRQGPVALLPLGPDPQDRARRSAPPGTGEPAAALPERQRYALVWCASATDDPVKTLDDAQRIAVLNTLLPAEAGQVVALSALKRFALGLNAERSLVAGRQVRIGNAAQTLHPVAGQGLNLGLRDAFSLVQALRFEPDVDRALRKVEWQRAPDRWSTIATTDFLARSFTWQWPGVAAARGLGLSLLQALPPLKRVLARQMMFGRR
jgi:2-octaprenyl-6-methoxyphenol hydroxylase